MWTILIMCLILLVLTIGVLAFLLYIQLKKIRTYEQWIVEYENWVFSVREQIRFTYIKMKSLDEKNIFFKDDDVGFVFSELLNLLKRLNDKISK
jgi:hypothetical protein